MWTARSDAKELRANREEIEGLMRVPAADPEEPCSPDD